MKRLTPRLIICLLVATLLGACAPEEPKGAGTSPLKEIQVAYDPNKAPLFEELLSVYNAQAAVRVQGVELEIPEAV